MVATPLHVADNRKSDFSAPQKIPDDGTESNTMSSEAISVNTLAAFLIGSRSRPYSNQGRSEQSASPRTASSIRKREEEASLLRKREEETAAEIAALNQFIFQAGNLYRGQRLTENEEAQLRGAAEHVGLSMEVVNLLLRHMADPNAMVNYCLSSDDGFARKFKHDPNFTYMMEEGSLSGGFDLSSSVWRVFLLRIVQQFLKEHDMELGDVMHTSSTTNQTYDEVLRNDTEKSEYDNRFAQFSNSMRDFTEERKHVSIDSEEAKKARLEAQVTQTTAPHPTFREVLEQGDSSSHIRQPVQAREGSHHVVHIESRDDDLGSRPGGFRSDEPSEAPRTTASRFPESRPTSGRESSSSERGQRRNSMDRQVPEEEENGAQETELSDNSDEGRVSAVKRGLAMFGKGASSTGTSPQSKPGGVRRAKSASRLSSVLAIFEKESQGTEQEVPFSDAKSCGPEFKSSSKRWPKKVQEPQFDSARRVGPELKSPSKWSRKIQETECESKSVGQELKSPSKWPKKAEEAQFDSAKTIGSEFKLSSKRRKQFDSARSVGPEFKSPSKWSRKVQETECESKSVGPELKSPSKWPKKAGSEFKSTDIATENPKSPFGNKVRNTMQMFGPSKINEPQGQGGKSNAVLNNGMGNNDNYNSAAYHHVQGGPKDPTGERRAEDAILGKHATEYFKNSDAQSTSERGYGDPRQRLKGESHSDDSCSEAPAEGAEFLHRMPDVVDTASGVDEVQAIYSSFTWSSDLSDDKDIQSNRNEADTKAFRSRTLTKKMRRTQRKASVRTSTHRSSPQFSNNRSYEGTRKHDSKTTGFEHDGNILPEQNTESRNEVASRSALQGWTNFKSNNAIPTYGRHGSFAHEADKNVDPFTGGSRFENASQGISASQSMNASRAKRTDPLPQSPTWHGSGIHALESKSPPNASFCPGSFQDPVDNAEAKRIQLKQQWNDLQAKDFTGVQEFSGVATPTAATVITNASSIDGWVPFESRKQKSEVARFDRRRWDNNLKEPSVENTSSGRDGKFRNGEGSDEDGARGRKQRSNRAQIRATFPSDEGSNDNGIPDRRQSSTAKIRATFPSDEGSNDLGIPGRRQRSSTAKIRATFPSDEGSYDNGIPGRRQRSSTAKIRAPAAAIDGEWARFEGSSLSAFDLSGYKGGEAEWKKIGLQAQDKSETGPLFIPGDSEKITSQNGNTKVSQRIKNWGKQGVHATPKGGEKMARCVSQIVYEGRDDRRMQPLNPTEPIGQSCYGKEDFSIANSSAVHRHAKPHRREPLHQEEWSSFPETSWRDQPSHLKAGSENKGRQATAPEQNREEPPPNEPVGAHGSNGRMQPLNPTEPSGQSCYGKEDFSVANSSTVHRHANPPRREPLHQEEWSSFPETSWRNQPSHLKAGSENKGRQATVPEQNREEPPPNEPGGIHGNSSNQHAYPNSEYQSEWSHAPSERRAFSKGIFDLDEVCKSRSADPALIKPQFSENTDKTDTFSAGSDIVDRYGMIRMDKAESVRGNISGHGVLEVRSMSTMNNQNPLPSHTIQGKRGHPNAQQKRHYRSKESTLHTRSETPATYPATEPASSLGDWSPGHWQNEENRSIKRLRTDEYSQSRASSLNESDLGLNSIDNLRDERSQESDISGLNPIQAAGTQTTRSLSSGSDFNVMNFYEATNGQPPELAFRAEQKDKPPVHKNELKESSLFTHSEKGLNAQYVHGSDRDGPHIKKGFHHAKLGLNRSNRVEAHFSRLAKDEMPLQETPQEYYGRGTRKYSNPADEPSFLNQRIPGLHGKREIRNDRPTYQPTSEGGNIHDQHSSAFHHAAPPSYNVGTTAANAFPHHRDDGSQMPVVLRLGCEEGAGPCGGFIETSHRPLNGRAPAQPDIEWIAFEKDRADRSNAQPARSAKAEFDALNAFLDEFQYDGKPLKVMSTRHGPPPDLVENRSSSTLSAILGVSADHQGKEDTHDLERIRRREDAALSQLVYPNQNQQLNSESDLENRRRKDKYANVNSTSGLTASGSDLSIDEAEIRATATLSGIPLDVVNVVLAQAKRSQSDVSIPGSSRSSLEKGQLFSSDGSIYVPNRKAEYKVVVGEVVPNCKTGYPVIVGEVVDDKKGGDKGVNPSTKSWETAEAMDDCSFGTPRAASTNSESNSSPCMPEGKTPVRRDASPTHFRSPEDFSEDQEPEGATEEEIKLLNRFIEVAASNFDGKRLSAESETRVRAAALKVGLSEVFVDQLIQQANDENNKNNKPQSTKSYVQKCLRTPNTQASRSFEITRAQKEAGRANAEAETFASGCQFWESLTQNLTYWTKPICGDILDDSSSVGLMSAPTLSWEEDASKQQHPPPRTPAQNDGRRGYV